MLDLLQGKKVRKQGASKDLKKKHRYQHALDLASVYDVHTDTVAKMVNGVPIKRPMKLVISDAASLMGCSIGQIEKILYPPKTRRAK